MAWRAARRDWTPEVVLAVVVVRRGERGEVSMHAYWGFGVVVVVGDLD